jgi:hypothetical protein
MVVFSKAVRSRAARLNRQQQYGIPYQPMDEMVAVAKAPLAAHRADKKAQPTRSNTRK